jgi:thiamine biosynthesis lipoprotein
VKLHSINFKAMGSPCELQLYLEDNKASSIGQQIRELINYYETKYSRYQPSSVTSRINASAGIETIELDEETAKLIDYAVVLHQQSDGLFDITSGILRKAWNFKSQSLPSAQEIEQLLPKIGWEKVEWKTPFIRLPYEGMEIDFGGYVKEYTADVVADFCLQNGVNQGLINLGGDIHVLGPHPNGSPWRVGIQHPRQIKKAIASIEISQGAIATSGDYERFMIIDGVRYSHLLNPFTGQSIQPKFASVSIVAARCLIAGSFSTIALLKSLDEPDWLNTVDLPHLVVDQQMNLSGFGYEK